MSSRRDWTDDSVMRPQSNCSRKAAIFFAVALVSPTGCLNVGLYECDLLSVPDRSELAPGVGQFLCCIADEQIKPPAVAVLTKKRHLEFWWQFAIWPTQCARSSSSTAISVTLLTGLLLWFGGVPPIGDRRSASASSNVSGSREISFRLRSLSVSVAANCRFIATVVSADRNSLERATNRRPGASVPRLSCWPNVSSKSLTNARNALICARRSDATI